VTIEVSAIIVQEEPVPLVPVCLLEPVWEQFAALLPARPAVSPTHPLGCHRRRVPDRRVFEHIVAALVHGSGYERIASPGCSDATIRRRLQEWAAAGLSEQVHTIALQAYDRMLGLELEDLAVDGCLTKAPSGGEAAGRSPVDRGKQGLKRSVVTDGAGIPLHVVSAGANRRPEGSKDAPLLGPTLAGLDKLERRPDLVTVHLDRGYDGAPTRLLLVELGFDGAIARKGVPAPIQAGSRWVVERTHSWMNGYGKLRRCTEKLQRVVDFYLFLAAALVVVRQLIQRARLRYRWPTRPTTRRLK
jgi:transposase